MRKGTVYLVGAGPGAPGLITVRGLECIKNAGVIVYDHLVDEALLVAAPPDAEKIYAGKTASRHTMKQDRINELLVDKARENRVVVRLKGGDPFVLGRGGEEAEFLIQHGISFEIVPGISSAVAVPAYAGIPVTHRELASYFTVVTGHEDLRKAESSIPWRDLARGTGTLVVLMGVGNLAGIVQELLAGDKDPGTPVAVITQGTGAGQRTVTGDLGNIVSLVEAEGITPPSVIVVGEVVRLREKLRWYDNRPLSGKRILVTRARHQASVLTEMLADRGAIPVEVPAVEILEVASHTGLDDALVHNIGDYDWVLFTSTNAVDAVFRRLRHFKKDARHFKGVLVGAIGPATAAALEQRGIQADYVPDTYTSKGVLEGLKGRGISGRRFLLPRADLAGPELAEGLAAMGAFVNEQTVYRTVMPGEIPAEARRLLQDRLVDAVTFTSSSTVRNLVRLLGNDLDLLSKPRIACIGPVTAEEAMKAGLAVDIMATEHTIPGLIDAMERYFAPGD